MKSRSFLLVRGYMMAFETNTILCTVLVGGGGADGDDSSSTALYYESNEPEEQEEAGDGDKVFTF